MADILFGRNFQQISSSSKIPSAFNMINATENGFGNIFSRTFYAPFDLFQHSEFFIIHFRHIRFRVSLFPISLKNKKKKRKVEAYF